MNTSDYKLAILIQNEFDAECASNNNDSLVAVQLQEEFNREMVCNSGGNLTYSSKSRRSQDNSKSLVDPSWELIDPTPNIHNLFIVFNERFFWNKLLSVCVSWSKRMTSCAGICSYNGRGGFCSITLSNPLLKLRPRKDLVETLLHEMIHAYLFVTHNNRDRDGHGPEFHKHMYRINHEAGTNITVFHSFHDEVRLYQQHWWRCDGPCQNRKPFFGIVRRAMNRAPGPNDRWWAAHQLTCGGTFIKVKEPKKQKPTLRKDSKTGSTLNGDIRKYISSPTKTGSNSQGKKSPVKSKQISSPNHDIRKFLINGEYQKGSPKIEPVFNNGNIHGFNNLGPRKNLMKTDFNKYSTKTVSNNSNTVVVSSNTKTGTKELQKQISFPGEGHALSSTSTSLNYNQVRNHWLQKYDNPNTSTKRQISNEGDLVEIPSKKTRIETTRIKNDDLVSCPICGDLMEVSFCNQHIDRCFNINFSTDENTEEDTNAHKICFICNKKVLLSEYDDHVSDCFNNSSDEGMENLVECPVCNTFVDSSIIENHTKECVEKAFKISQNETETDNVIVDSLTQCSICSEFIEAKTLNLHQEQCLSVMMDDIEAKYGI